MGMHDLGSLTNSPGERTFILGESPSDKSSSGQNNGNSFNFFYNNFQIDSTFQILFERVKQMHVNQ